MSETNPKKVVIVVGKSRITIMISEYDPAKHELYKPTQDKKRGKQS